jgi:hypothetical protein
MFLGFGASALAQHSVTLAWDPSTSGNIADYKIYYGQASHTYTGQVHLGNVTQGTVTGLTAGVTYYFAVTAVDTTGVESDYSGEASYTVPLVLAKLQLRLSPTRQVILDATGPAGQRYDLLCAPRLGSWTNLATLTLGTNGAAQFIDSAAAGQPSRLYRLREK